jgi:hypothetical protein
MLWPDVAVCWCLCCCRRWRDDGDDDELLLTTVSTAAIEGLTESQLLTTPVWLSLTIVRPMSLAEY